MSKLQPEQGSVPFEGLVAQALRLDKKLKLAQNGQREKLLFSYSWWLDWGLLEYLIVYFKSDISSALRKAQEWEAKNPSSFQSSSHVETPPKPIRESPQFSEPQVVKNEDTQYKHLIDLETRLPKLIFVPPKEVKESPKKPGRRRSAADLWDHLDPAAEEAFLEKYPQYRIQENSTHKTWGDEGLGNYMNLMGGHRLLEREMEVYPLIGLLQQGLRAVEQLKQLEKNQPDIEIPQDLLEVIKTAQGAKAVLINHNARLVVSVAKKYLERGLSLSELIQEGNIGLSRALDKFDVNRGVELSTYITWWIRQQIQRATVQKGNVIRVPVHIRDRITKILKAQERLMLTLGRYPTLEEVVDELEGEWTIEQIEEALEVRKNTNTRSLEEPSARDEDSVFGDFVRDERFNVESEGTGNIDTENFIRLVLDLLPDNRYKFIIYNRFFHPQADDVTLEMVGKALGVTRERVRQLEVKAKNILVKNRKINKWREDLGRA